MQVGPGFVDTLCGEETGAVTEMESDPGIKTLTLQVISNRPLVSIYCDPAMGSDVLMASHVCLTA